MKNKNFGKQIFVFLLTSALLCSVSLGAMECFNPGAKATLLRGAQQVSVVQPVSDNQQKLTSILKKLLTTPWNFGGAMTSHINSGTIKVEPATQVFMRCFLGAVLCSLLLYLASGKVISDAADNRYLLAKWNFQDFFSSDPFHYTYSRLMMAFSGLQYFATFLGISGIRLYGLIFGTIIGLRSAYDGFFKLPISIIWGKAEEKKRPDLFSFRHDD